MNEFKVGDPRPKGDWRAYRKVAVAEMLKMKEPFTCWNREGEQMQGQPGDFLVEDGYGGYYPCGAEFHQKNYGPARGR